MNLVKRFLRYPFFVLVIALLCIIGAGTNLVLMFRDLSTSFVLLRLHMAFFILYVAQTVFILTAEKYVCLLTFLQAILALLTTVDFIFVPVLQIIGMLYQGFSTPTLEQIRVYQYVFVSAAFTLQMASAVYLWGYFRSLEKVPAR